VTARIHFVHVESLGGRGSLPGFRVDRRSGHCLSYKRRRVRVADRSAAQGTPTELLCVVLKPRRRPPDKEVTAPNVLDRTRLRVRHDFISNLAREKPLLIARRGGRALRLASEHLDTLDRWVYGRFHAVADWPTCSKHSLPTGWPPCGVRLAWGLGPLKEFGPDERRVSDR
jgi:hypothetical protein